MILTEAIVLNVLVFPEPTLVKLLQPMCGLAITQDILSKLNYKLKTEVI